MKKKIALILILTLLLALCAFAACEDPHEHDLQHFEAKDPNCENDGNIEYWYCAGCGKYFADEAAGTEIAKEKTVLAASGEHDWSAWVIDSESSCTIGGMRHRVCSDCGERQEEALPIGEHDMTHVAAVGATCIDEGNVEYWHCDICGKNFADQNAEELIENISLPLGAHNFVDGKCTVCGIDEIFIKGTPGLQYTLNEDGTAYIASGMGTATDTDIVIASEYNGLPVTSIGDNAFYNCSSLTSINIPDSITSIGSGAFFGCSSLTSISIPEGVTSMGDYAFYDCSSLTSLTIPDSVTSIGDYAFSWCTSLESITIGGSVTSIGDSAFDGCDSLASITIPDSVTSIGVGAFYDCDSLESVTIGNGVTSIGDYAFYYCSSLTSISIPDGVTSIGSYAFSGCSSLASIVIPDGVTSIGYGAFSGCSSLTSIVIPESVTSISDYAFFGCSSLTSITFQGSMKQWKAIYKGTEWNSRAGSFTITCTDGTLDKNGNQI